MRSISHFSNKQGKTVNLAANHQVTSNQKQATPIKNEQTKKTEHVSKAQMLYLKQISRLENKANGNESIQQEMKPILQGLIKKLESLDKTAQQRFFNTPFFKDKSISSIKELAQTLSKDFTTKPTNIKEGFSILKSKPLLKQLFPHLKPQATYSPFSKSVQHKPTQPKPHQA